MRLLLVSSDGARVLDELPQSPPERGFLWIASAHQEFEAQVGELQGALQRLAGGQLVDLHISDLLNNQLPSHYDYTSWYDMLVFRRLAAAADEQGAPGRASHALPSIDTSPVGFAVFDRVLLTVHPADCQVREFFVTRLQQMAQQVPELQRADGRTGTRLPSSPADLMLRMVNHIVDGYLDLRRLLTRQLTSLQNQLFQPRGHFRSWQVLLDSRNALHLLEDICEDQRSAVQEWIDAMAEWPPESAPAAARERELLRVRSRDVLEHIERVLGHVRRLESSAETAVQMHFSAQSHRAGDIMRTLTVLTAIFLPLNLITGIFGMNFDALPLIHSATGVWIALGLMLAVGAGLGMFFWRKRYLGTHH
ncbi:magnesium transporter CorA family protein [Methylibium rhizosphaerae]|uniref:magnesium transporter CorA family protein n=1 Tax=Methylibium rhizosphaerae TaxID=2570323 RepID=UPI00112EDF07|nr:magnesium transporter CorA family protein [Methylibium rhizosphaerae]